MYKLLFHKLFKGKFFILIIISFLAEFFIFNFRHWESLNYQPINYTEYTEKTLNFENGIVTLEFQPLNFVLHNIYLDCIVQNQANESIAHQKIEVSFYGKDDANSLFLLLGKRENLSYLERTQYYRINQSGNSHALKLEISSEYQEAATLLIHKISFNTPIPLMFSLIRFTIVNILLCLIYLLRPLSTLYHTKFEEQWKYRQAIIIMSCFFLCVLSITTVLVNSKSGDSQETKTQYHDLTRSLAKGQTYLDIVPTDELLSLSNPYDAPLRNSMLKRGEGYLGDYALFEGKYYCYFGILPVITTFLPYYLITGEQLPFSIATSIWGIILILGIFLLLYKIFQIYFSKSPFYLYIVTCWMMIFCSGLFFAFRAVKFYALPILCAAGLSIWGLYFWLRSLEKTGCQFIFHVVAGTLCVSLTALSRPQFLVTFLFVFIIFKEQLSLAIKRHSIPWKIVMPILIPALIIASITMGYNYIRFHSVFDFGANYNLCSNDMRYRGWHWDRTFLAIYYYLFSPVITKPVFPFLEPNTLFTNYLGVTIFEEMFGGYYALMPFLFISTLAFLPKIQFKKTNIRCFSCISFMLAILILVVDAQMAGIVSRYRMDFGWLLCLSAIFVIVEIEYQASQSTIRYIMRIGIVTSLLSAMIYELLLIFNTTNIGTWWHPYFYYTAKSLLQFWN